MYGGFIVSCGGSFESSRHCGVDFGARIHYRVSFIMSKLVTMWSVIKNSTFSIAKNIAFKIHRFFEKLRLFSMWKEYWLGGQKRLINHVSHANEKRHKVIKIKLHQTMTDDLIIKNFFPTHWLSHISTIFSHNQKIKSN